MNGVEFTCIERIDAGNPFARRREYNLTISDDFLMRVPLDRFDMMLIKECEESEKIEDKLLALETIVRKGNQS
jgi:hypothetical protein